MSAGYTPTGGASQKESANLAQLPNYASLIDDDVVEVLHNRYRKDSVYTQIGNRVLLAVNPNGPLEISNDVHVQQYVDDYRNTSGQRTVLDPHVFQIAANAYLMMRRTGADQSLVFSGISGSGKSENMKLAIRLFSFLRTQSKRDTRLYTQLMQAQSILEAFGNAKTTMNRNASRFGCYIELQFDEHGRTIGAKFLDYLLEKSRVTNLPSQERNFHVFYQLLNGASADERSHFHLSEPGYFAYLEKSGVFRVPDTNDAVQFVDLCASMKSLGLNKKYQKQIFQLLSAILHLGNIQFVDLPDNHQAQEPCEIRNMDVLSLVAGLLGIDELALQGTLTFKTKMIKREVCTVFLDAQQARQQRDDLAKSLYSLLFSWIVEFLNTKLCKEDSQTSNFIGLLDLFGFQNLASNGFEQFLVNFANERLYYFTAHHIFDLGRDEMVQEGLGQQSPEVSFADNSPCLDLYMKPVSGLISLLDKHINSDTNNRHSQGPDEATQPPILNEFNRAHADSKKGSPVYRKSENKNFLGAFVIQHFAGPATYNSNNFAENNVDSLNADFVALFRGTEVDDTTSGTRNTFVAGLFTERAVAMEVHPRHANTIVAAQQKAMPTRQPSMKRVKKRTSPLPSPAEEAETSNEKGGNSRKNRRDKKPVKIPCVGTQFQRALSDLFDTLDQTQPWFIFCLAANDVERPQQWDARLVKNQVRSFGLTDVVKRKVIEYAHWLSHDEFLTRYKPVVDSLKLDQSRDARTRCDAAGSMIGWGYNDMAVGNRQVFLSFTAWRDLEDNLRAIEKQQNPNAMRDEGGALGDDPYGIIPNSSLGGPGVESMGSYESHDGLIQNMGNRGGANAGSGRFGSGRGPFMGAALGGDDARSYYSDDDYTADRGDDTISNMDSDMMGSRKIESDLKHPTAADPMLPSKEGIEEEKEDKPKLTTVRRRWLCCTWLLTWWIPSPLISCCGRLKRKDQQIAWREKVALCILIFFLCGVTIFWIGILGPIVCPKQNVYTIFELNDRNTKDDPYFALRGNVYTMKDFNHHDVQATYLQKSYAGQDLTNLFPIQLSLECTGFDIDPRLTLTNQTALYTDAYAHDHRYYRHPDNLKNWFRSVVLPTLNRKYYIGQMAVDPKEVAKAGAGQGSTSRVQYQGIIDDQVFDLTNYVNYQGVPYFIDVDGNEGSVPSNNGFLDAKLVNLFRNNPGMDVTKTFNQLFGETGPNRKKIMTCLQRAFYMGVVDKRNSAQCYFANYILLACSIALASIILFKFIAALQLGSRREPEDHDRFVILNVPCYTESEDSLRLTIDSLAVLKYDDKRKLLFIIADGMLVGSGNDRPTPRIVLDILGVDPSIDPEPLSYLALGDGRKQHNMAKVYSGLYEKAGHVVPYLVIAKTGHPSERARPGNRGKRDSQIVLMKFFNHVHFNKPMSPMELEMYHQIKNVIGVNPAFYEYVLMVDADTEVYPESLNRMISCMIHDSKLMGLCGETHLSNEKSTWITMIQVYEYFISHHMAKAFESLFGSVTCLPGCFCMYRLRTPEKNSPLLISNLIIDEYEDNRVDTLHKKNLLSLGEDRYLTTLMLKHFPFNKNKFTPDAQCKTNAPDTWSVLLSQRRRWINSTIHNLFELVFLPRLCGFCCFSMRFIVFIDLFGTLVMPATVAFLVYLIYQCIAFPDNLPIISLVILAATYALQAIIFILKRQWQHIGWMIVYIIAIPVFMFFIPLYSFWHFDDFSWGNTRTVTGEKGQKIMVAADEGKFDPASIPTKKWSEYEQELWEAVSNYGGGATGVPYGQGNNRQSRSLDRLSRAQSSYDVEMSNLGGVPPALPGMTARYSTVSGVHGVDMGYDNTQGRMSAYNHPARPQSPAVSVRSNTPGPSMMYGGNGAAMPFNGPSDDEILAQIRQILDNANLMTITKKQVRDELSDRFGIDMLPKKDHINSCIEMILQGKL
ncbi:chitin synthase-domain-containing protein [Dimargaris cristalligena]|uniref:chitin synthase n=1 Tax=Dimargaris cristalligena TaxID=215637 RepID=A0A4V1J554_9FUNG|nr:chitin synthase-domain-containing protein [Dimargaris cristalligena]|eukprot:RKP37869.1 chitin synthase-domain-containing protein [Dimargaris cristalligena]